jgi:phosphohistidine swiveling domain-containing protein
MMRRPDVLTFRTTVREPRVIRWQQAEHTSPHAIGGKAANLVRLQRAGLPVPSWFCVTSAVFRDVAANAWQVIEQDVLHGNARDPAQAAAMSARATEAIHATGLSEHDRAALHECFQELAVDSPFAAVRSSVSDEDSAAASFAGQMDSYLFVPEHALERRVLDCFASCFSPRALAYRSIHGRAPVKDAGVIVQRMIDSRVSGVLFTANPTTGDPTETVVSAAIGVGEGVVADRAEADTFFVEAATLTLRRRVVAHKRSRVAFDATQGSGTAVVDVAEAESATSALDEEQIASLTRLGSDIQSLFGAPQDIEWALDSLGRIHVLQARPITTLVEGRQTIFDNANIVESYPGFSLPLTFSVVRAAYETTFRTASRRLGVPESVLRANQAVHANLVALVNGSIYYNLLNWYMLFLFVPGFEGALPAWERALGVRGITPPRPPPATTRMGRLIERHRQLRVTRRLIWNFIRLDSDVEDFRRVFGATLAEFKATPLDEDDAHDLVARYERLVDRIVSRYSISVVNDAFVQQAYSLLGKLVARWNLGERTLHHDLFAGGGVMESVRPVQSLLALAREIREDPALRELFATRPAGDIWTAIDRDRRYADFRARLLRHFDEFGDRTFQELKLETPLAEEAPELRIELLRNYAAQADPEGGARANAMGSFPASIERRQLAEKTVAAGLARHPLRRAIFGFLLRRARRMVTHREDLRLMRSRAFGMVKRVVRALGQRLTRAGLIDQPHDVFYLSIEEITGAVRGTSITRDLRVLVTQRRHEYEVFKRSTPQARVTIRGIALANVASAAAPAPAAAAGSARELHGVACSAGRVRARARVVRTPEQHLDIRGEILVAPMTDPGWVFLMVPAGGLIVERGSILSHTAIIGRELGIPTVVGVADATSIIADGQLVEIDGAAGIVRLLD